MIGVLLIFIGYQLYRIALDPTVGLIALTAFDALIVALTWREYTRQPGGQSRPRHRPAGPGHDQSRPAHPPA